MFENRKPCLPGLQNYESFEGDRRHQNEYFAFFDRLVIVIDLELKKIRKQLILEIDLNY
jgi:hypothetical protein